METLIKALKDLFEVKDNCPGICFPTFINNNIIKADQIDLITNPDELYAIGGNIIIDFNDLYETDNLDHEQFWEIYLLPISTEVEYYLITRE